MPIRSTVLAPQVILSQSTVYASQGNIYALQASSGTIRQSYPIQGLAFLTVVNDTMLYLNVSHHPDYFIQALRGSDGNLLWSYKVEEGRLTDAPVIVDEVVYASVIEGTIYALQARDGTLLWRVTIDADPDIPAFLGPHICASPTIANEVMYLAPMVDNSLQPFLYALQVKDGTLLWKAQITNSTLFPLTILDKVIYISAHQGCSALRASDGSSLWQQETETLTRSLPVVANGMVYNSAVRYDHFYSASVGKVEQRLQAFLCARQASDGSLLWQREVGNATSTGNPTTPVVIQDTIYIGADGQLYAFQASDGIRLWHSQIEGISLSSPTGTNGVVYAGADDGCVYAFRASDGTLLWQTFVSTAVTGASSITLGATTLTNLQ